MDRPTGGDASPVKNDDQASARPGAAVYIGRASFRMIADPDPGFDAGGQVTAPPVMLAQPTSQSQSAATDPWHEPAGASASVNPGARVEVDPAVHVDIVVDAPELPRLRIVPQLPEGIRPSEDAAIPDATEAEQPRRWRSVAFGALAVVLIGAGGLGLRARAMSRAAPSVAARETAVRPPAVAASAPVPLSDVVVPSTAPPAADVLPPPAPSRSLSVEVTQRARRPASVAARARTISKSRGTRARAERGSPRLSARSTAASATASATAVAGGSKKHAKAAPLDRATD